MQPMTISVRARPLAIRSILTVTAAAAILLTGAIASEAKSQKKWRNANASISSGGFAGKASYYGPGFAGRKTASGARFNPGAMTAAHRSLPFGTKLRVSHGGRSVLVTINDRGPFIHGRVLDLSKGAASAIGLTSRGVGHVTARIERPGAATSYASAE